MKYKVLECEDYADFLDFHFYIDKCEDASGNIVYCLVACSKGSKHEYYLIENSEFITYTQINKKIRDFLMREIETKITNKLLSLKLNIRYGFVKYSDYFQIIDYHGNNSYFAHLDDFEGNYDLLTESIINYLEELALDERLNTK